ncbi:monocarboxylate transporter 5 isoform X2 [Episyrphus balteatus]|nr:monocarboxylate transporter 5 isoform X2 [Episyrphus balteatus]
MTYSFGMFYVEFLDYFNEGKGYTAWIVSILVGVTLASGPISSSFVNRYGCRPVTIAGSILASICILISMFAQNVLTLIFTIGIGTGLGFGLIYLPAIVSVTMYFEKYRSLATGIAVCGSGFGTFVFSPLTESLIGNFGWRGAMLIISGLVLNCIIFGAMFRPIEPPKKVIEGESAEMAELAPLNSKKSDQFLQTPRSDTNLSRSYSVGHDFGYEFHTTNQNGKLSIPTISSNNNIRSATSQPHINGEGQQQPVQGSQEKFGSGMMYRQDILYQGSLLNIPEYRSRNDLNVNRYGSLKHSIHKVDSTQEVEKICGCVSCSKETRDTLSEMMNFSLFKDWIFIIFTFSNFCTSIGFNMPYVYIAAQAETLGLDKQQSSYLLATIGIANTVGRIILGYISDKPWVNRLLIYNLCLTTCGIATALCIFCTDFYSLAVYASVFGFTIGAYVGLTSVILVDLLGLDKLTNAFGLLLLFQGLASLVGPPIGGFFYDITGSYGPAFVLAGVMICISGLILFAIPPLQRHYARKAKKQQAVNGTTAL